MRQITIALPDSLYTELEAVTAASAREMAFRPEDWATEAVEVAIISRRTMRVRLPITPAEALGRKPVELSEDDS